MSDQLKKKKTCDLSQELIQKEINNYSAGHSAKSTANLHGFISAVLSVYRPNMILHTTLPQKVKYEAYTPSEDEVKKVLETVKGTDYEIAYRLGCYGMRRGEICAIDLGDLDGNLLHITKSKVLGSDNKWIVKPIPKTTGSQRTIYIDDELADMIRAQGFAFNDHPNRLNHHLHRTLKRLEIPLFRFHDLRAYYASMSHSLGIPDAYICANGGWTSTNILNRVYKRAFADKQAETNKRIADHLKP
jgi:integrase